MLLTDALLLDYKRCQRRAFLNLYGNPDERDQERDFLLKLRQENQHHIAAVLAQYYPDCQQVQSPPGDWQAKAKETAALMAAGASCIYQGLLWQDREGTALVGNPHLLVKQPGVSKFGDWLYCSTSIHLGRRPKPEYKLIAAYYAQLLASVQGVLPPASYLILRRQNRYTVDLLEWLPRLQATLAECLPRLAEEEEPEVFISRQRCSLCHWHGHCYEIAQSQQHLSLVPGVTPSRYEFLQAMGVATVESLAAACPIDLGELMGKAVASQLKQQAQSLVEKRAIRRPEKQSELHRELPTATIELYFDIEAEPERNLDYLLGILLVDRRQGTEKFYSFLAEKPEDEGKIWQQFLKLVNQYEQAPIFHFSEYEAETIKRLGVLYRTPRRQIEPLLSRFVDLHHRVTHSVTLPVESYSLKSLANWLGFQWRDVGAGGDQCVCWYDQWLQTGDRSFLELILRYNEDDCRATFYLKDWLVKFLLEP